jgi:uncharacterized OsmC-like protein
MSADKMNLRDSQAPLRSLYKTSPRAAWVTDHARTQGDATDPFHSTVAPAPEFGVTMPVGVHRAIGGPHDAPTPGDILCAALAACQDSAIRIVANLLGVELESITVEVSGDVDVRGAMAVAKDIPVGFQSMQCNVRIGVKEGTSPELLEKLQVNAERCCLVLQTLRAGVPVEAAFNVTAV